ncbi:MAG: diguanylate cyclase [Candidatus Thiodiazotropha sp. (ex Epidulcina cf. delphinae)]|nr:diguanylate cyclase [Candidatus Thiodiazotropha sp. (ex Epidulcina cf. delphinae)]
MNTTMHKIRPWRDNDDPVGAYPPHARPNLSRSRMRQAVSRPLSILLIDDSPSERALLRARLKQIGHKVTEAPDGIRALSHLEKFRRHSDLILLDICMPGLDGFETATRIRALEKEQAEGWLPIIFLSGKSNPHDIARGIMAGGDDYLTKPVNTTVLKAKIFAMQRIAEMRQQLLDMKRRLEIQAHTDELTRLPNRRHFLAILDSEIARARRHGTPLSIAYLDLDHFKRINDSYGHDTGDAVLRKVSATLDGGMRTEDSIGRLGGEEFCICLPGSNAEQGMEPCERYRSLLESLVIDNGTAQGLKLTASFGLTGFNRISDNRSTLLARADKALYQAKQAGRNRVGVVLPDKPSP